MWRSKELVYRAVKLVDFVKDWSSRFYRKAREVTDAVGNVGGVKSL